MIINSYVYSTPGGGGLPTDADLLLWLEARKEIGFSNNDPMATLTDWAAGGNDFVQASGTLQPLYQTGIMNGQPGFFFDGSNDFVECPAFLSGDADVMIVLKKPGSPIANGGFLKFDGNSLASHCLFSGTFYDSMGGGGRAIFTPTSGVAAAGWVHHIQMKAGASQWIAYENGNTTKATQTQTISWYSGATPRHLIGASSDQPNGSTITNYFDGWILALKVWNRILTSAERNAQLAEFQTLYGISFTSF